MKPVKINCPHCNQFMEYWTKENYIYCPQCKEKIEVEPCEDKLDDEKTPEKLAEEEANKTSDVTETTN